MFLMCRVPFVICIVQSVMGRGLVIRSTPAFSQKHKNTKMSGGDTKASSLEKQIESKEEAIEILNTLVERNLITLDEIRKLKGQIRQAKKGKGEVENEKKRRLPIPVKETSARDAGERYITRHIALRIHYDGRNYTGLAENVNSETDQSVERVLFAALKKTCLISDRKSCNYSRSGRTDKGVSAFGQVVALQVSSAFPIGTRVADGENGSEEYILLNEC